MKRTYDLLLADYPVSIVRLACWTCDRRASFTLAQLMRDHDGGATMFDVLDVLASECPQWDYKPGQFGEPCGACFPDLVSVGPCKEPRTPPKLTVVR